MRLSKKGLSDVQAKIVECITGACADPETALRDCLNKNRKLLALYNKDGSVANSVKVPPPSLVTDYMQIAVSYLNVNAAKILYESGIFQFEGNPNYFNQLSRRNVHGETEKQKITEMFKFLLEHKVSPLYQEGDLNPLDMAIRWHNSLMVELVTDADPQSLNVRDVDGLPLAVTAARICHNTHILEILKRKGANLFKATGRYVPLNEALKNYNNIAAEYFLDNGANVNIKDGFSNIAAHCLSSSLLSEKICKRIIKETKDINRLNQSDCTPLHVVFKSPEGHKWIRLMINYGADINKENKKGYNPVAEGFRSLSADDVKSLYSKGFIDFNYRNSKGETYPMLMVQNARPQSLPGMLLFAAENGADFNAVSDSGRTIFDYLPRNSIGRLEPGYKKSSDLIKSLMKEQSKETEPEEEIDCFGF